MTTFPNRSIKLALLTVLLCWVGSPVRGAASIQSPNLSTGALVKTAAAYVGTYQAAFSFLLADETTEQRVVSRPARGTAESRTRTTRSEVFLTYLETRKQWTVVRDVAEVDGVPVQDREDFARLIGTEDPVSLARRLFALNARFNIGRVVRNFNDPMLSLLPLNDAHRSRFSFSVARVDRSEPGQPLATLRYREKDRPTLVQGLRGGPVYSSGEITIDPADGTVRGARMAMTYDGIDVELATDFVREERLGLWVPSVFVERYSSSRDGLEERTTCESRYSNYRRFEATGRIRER